MSLLWDSGITEEELIHREDPRPLTDERKRNCAHLQKFGSRAVALPMVVAWASDADRALDTASLKWEVLGLSVWGTVE